MLPFLDKKRIADSIIAKRVKGKIRDEDKPDQTIYRKPDEPSPKPKYNSMKRQVQKALTERRKGA